MRSGTRVHYLASGAATNGELGLYRWDMGPRPSGPAAHFHKTISESLFILSGTVRLFDGRRWIDATPGDFLFVPEGGIHAFRNESGEPASMLLLFAPGAPREEYFETLAQMAEGLVLSDEERAEFFVRHDNYWLGVGGTHRDLGRTPPAPVRRLNDLPHRPRRACQGCYRTRTSPLHAAVPTMPGSGTVYRRRAAR